jgi:hypothetical protein
MSRIIVLSYGIRRQTKRALEQARRFGHEIQLVPAIPSATRGLRTHQSSLVTVHDLVGREGLRAALADASGPVLMLHEDVLLHPDVAARLLEVAESTGMIAVPRTNHDDVDGPAGELPGDVVQPLGLEQEPYQIERARTVCLAGPASRLDRLTAQRLTAATTRLYFQDRTALLVPDAVATHLDLGPDQLEDPVGPDGRPLLVASMIVKDEEMFLEDCLASLDGLVDRIDICDTGSTDRTVEIAEAAGANVTHVEWRDDFAWARNQALEMSKDAWWVLQVDADERVRVADPTAFRRFLATALADGEGFDVPLRDVAVDGSELGGQQLPRIFLGASTVFRGRVHEVAQFRGGAPIAWAVTTALEVEHHGYRPEVIQARDKLGRNLRLARADHAAAPTLITGLQMARSLPWGDERLQLLRELHAEIKAGDDTLNEAGQVPVFQLFAHGLMQHNKHDEAWAVIEDARALFPHVPVIRAAHAEIGTKLGRHDEVLSAAGAPAPVEGARPWVDHISESVTRIELAKSQLAIDALDGAAITITELLEGPIPGTLQRWDDIIAMAALVVPDRIVDLLLPHAVADGTGGCIMAAARVFDPHDAAAFAVEAVRLQHVPDDRQRSAAWDIVIAGDNAEAFEVLCVAAELSDDQIAANTRTAGPAISTYLRLRGVDVEAIDFDAINASIDSHIEALAAGDGDVEAAAAAIASDPTGLGLDRLSKATSSGISAPVAAAAVRNGLDGERELTLALILCTLADDAVAAVELEDALGSLSTEAIRLLRTRASDRGSAAMAGFFTRHLLNRSV